MKSANYFSDVLQDPEKTNVRDLRFVKDKRGQRQDSIQIAGKKPMLPCPQGAGRGIQ